METTPHNATHSARSFHNYLEEKKIEDSKNGLTRTLRIHSSDKILFSENDYLGLARSANLLSECHNYLQSNNLGSGSARLLSGNAPIQVQMEEKLAHFKGTESALTFSSGYLTACGTIPCLVESGDFLVFDRCIHACFLDAAKLSQAALRVFPHNDLNHLEEILKHTRMHHPKARILIGVESVYSMDGDLAPLREIVELKEKYQAHLMVDEAHSTGILGARRRGLCELSGIDGQVEVQMGTLGKALGVCGGYIAGSSALVSLLIQRARPFLFSTAPPPVLAAALAKAIDIVAGDEGQRLQERLTSNIAHFHHCFENQLPTKADLRSPIKIFSVGDEQKALAISTELENHLFYLPAIRYPTVPRGKAVLRASITALHTHEQIEGLASCLIPLLT